MADKIELEVVTPKEAVFHDFVDDVVVPGKQGEMDILPGHLPLLATLTVGEMRINDDGKERHFLIDQGYAEVVGDRVTVLTEACEGVDDIDIAAAKERLTRSREDMSALEEMAQTEVVEEALMERHRLALKRARMRLAFAEEQE